MAEKKHANMSLGRNAWTADQRIKYADEKDSPHPTGHVIAKGRAALGAFQSKRPKPKTVHPSGPLKMTNPPGHQKTADQLKSDQERHYW